MLDIMEQNRYVNKQDRGDDCFNLNRGDDFLSEPDLSDLIGRVYDTALNPEDWPNVLEEIGTRLGGRGAILFEVLGGERKNRLIAPYYSANYLTKSVETYLKLFNEVESEDQLLYAKISAAQDKIELIDDTQIFPDRSERLNRDNIRFLHNLDTIGIGYRAGALLNKDTWNIDRFSVQYDVSHGAPTAEERYLASLLLPHVSKALRIGRPLISRHQKTIQSLQARIDLMKFGVALMNRNGELLISNIEFSRIVDETGAFIVSPNHTLRVREASVRAKYQELMSNNRAHAQSGANPRREAITVPVNYANLEGTVLIEISPASCHPGLGALPKGTRLVTALDTSQTHVVDTAVLAKFFPISKSESEILELIAEGHSNLQIAEMRNRNVETIKSQTKSLFRKTHTSNRTELVQLALSINSPFSQLWI